MLKNNRIFPLKPRKNFKFTFLTINHTKLIYKNFASKPMLKKKKFKFSMYQILISSSSITIQTKSTSITLNPSFIFKELYKVIHDF